MKAFAVTHYGPEGLEAADVPTASAGPRDVLVDVGAASINPLDTMVRNGEFKQLIKYKRPFVLGHDLAGVITEVGAEVRGLKADDEVYARPRDLRIGAFAEQIAVEADDVALKPTSLSFEEAAAVPLVALAAWQALVDVAASSPGRRSWSKPVPAGSDPPSSRSPSISVRTSLPRRAPRTSARFRRSARTRSSTTRRRTSPTSCPDTTWCWTPSARRVWRSR